MDYIAPRSVKRLEDEIAELEKLEAGETSEETEEEEEPTEIEEELPEEKEEIAPAPQGNKEDPFKKRYDDIRRYNQKLVDELKSIKTELSQEKSKKAGGGLPTAEEAEAWAKENPKAAAIIRAIASEQTHTQSEELTSIKEKLSRTEQEARILKSHPDFEEVAGSDEFHDWAEKQPKSVQALIYSSSADDVIWAMGQFKRENAVQPNPKKEAAKAVATKTASAEPKTEGKGRFTESQVRKMSISEFEKNEAAIQKAIQNGSFVYDLSGAAR